MDLTALGLLPLPLLRLAGPADAEAIAQVHHRAWVETYGGILPAALIDRPSLPERVAVWRRTLDGDDLTVFVATPHGDIEGFVALGWQRNDSLRLQGFAAEVNAIYLLRAAQGRGLGRALMSAVAHWRLDCSARSGLALWALNANRHACGFYRALGGTEVAERTDSYGPQTAFGWPTVEALL